MSSQRHASWNAWPQGSFLQPQPTSGCSALSGPASSKQMGHSAPSSARTTGNERTALRAEAGLRLRSKSKSCPSIAARQSSGWPALEALCLGAIGSSSGKLPAAQEPRMSAERSEPPALQEALREGKAGRRALRRHLGTARASCAGMPGSPPERVRLGKSASVSPSGQVVGEEGALAAPTGVASPGKILAGTGSLRRKPLPDSRLPVEAVEEEELRRAGGAWTSSSRGVTSGGRLASSACSSRELTGAEGPPSGPSGCEMPQGSVIGVPRCAGRGTITTRPEARHACASPPMRKRRYG